MILIIITYKSVCIKIVILNELTHKTIKWKSINTDILTLVLLRGVVPTPLTVFALVLKIAQPRGKIAPGTFKFILSLHFILTSHEGAFGKMVLK